MYKIRTVYNGSARKQALGVKEGPSCPERLGLLGAKGIEKSRFQVTDYRDERMVSRRAADY